MFAVHNGRDVSPSGVRITRFKEEFISFDPFSPFADDHEEKGGAIVVVVIKLLQVTNLATEETSGEAREDQNNRLGLVKSGELHGGVVIETR